MIEVSQPTVFTHDNFVAFFSKKYNFKKRIIKNVENIC